MIFELDLFGNIYYMGKKKLKKSVVISIAVICATAASGVGYRVYALENKRKREAEKQRVISELECTLNGDGILEYGKETVDSLTLVTVSDDADDGQKITVTAAPVEIDRSVVGTQKVIYTLSTVDAYNDEVSKKFEKAIEVKDTQAPAISLSQDSVTLEYGSSFDPNSVVSSVQDPVDGDLEKVDQEPETPDVSGNGWYTVTSDVDTSVPGEYSVTVHAVDKNGNAAEDKHAAVTVQDKVSTASSLQSSQAVTSNASPAGSTDTFSVSTPGDTGNATLNSLADDILSGIINDSMSDREKCYAIYQWTENHIRYTGGSDHSDWVSGGITALSTRRGDCYAFYSGGRSLLTRAGFQTMEMKFPNNGHYWVKVYIDGSWLNWDATTGWGTERFLWTDDQLHNYSYYNASSGETIYYYF